MLVLLNVFVLAKNKTQKRRDEGRTHEAKIHLKLIRFNAPLDSKGKQLFSCSTGQLLTWPTWQLALAKQIKQQQNQWQNKASSSGPKQIHFITKAKEKAKAKAKAQMKMV